MTISGGGGSSATFDNLDSVEIGDLEDDLEIIIEDDVLEGDKPLRGQNEVDGAEEDDEPDYDNPRFKERIQQEVRLREEGEAKALEQQERVEFALLKSEQTKISTQRDSFKLALDGLDVRIATTTEALKYAKQEGDTSAEVDLEIKLRNLSQLRGSIEENMGRLPDERALEQQFKDHITNRRNQLNAKHSQASQGDAPKALNQKASEWTKRNGWMNDTSKAKEKAALMEVNNALAAEGYDPNSNDFFTELSRRLAKRFPDLNVKTLDGGQMGGQPAPRQAQGQRSAPPVAAARSSAPPSQVAKTKHRVGLDGSDIALMKMFRIDPNDPAARKRYAAEKFKRVQSETRR
jgi:hypothetical protein